MERTELLPLGSIVIINGGVKKLMVITRAVATEIGGENKYFDYAACLYPEGLQGASVLYFNHEDIQQIVYGGYSDEDETIMLENIYQYIERSGYKKGSPYELNQQNQQKLKNE